MAMPTLTPKEKFSKAKIELLRSQPFFALRLYQMETKEDPTCATGWTDGRTIAYNPVWLDKLTLDQAITFLFHESDHVRKLHHLREGSRDHMTWNIAGDYNINLDAVSIGLKAIPNWLYDDQYKGLCVEEIYYKLEHQPKPPEEQPGGQGQGQGKGDKGKEKVSSQTPSSDSQEGSGDGDGDKDANNGKGQAGEGEDKDTNTDPGGCGEVRPMTNEDGSEMSPAEVSQQVQKEITDAKASAQVAKARGLLPGFAREALGEISKPKVDWRSALHRFATARSKNDYGYKQNRRYVQAGIIMRALDEPSLGTILAFVDVSGSVDREQATQFYSELYSILLTYPGTKIVWAQVSTHVVKTDELTIDSPMPEANDRGGTDYAPAFVWARENMEETPVASIYLTDGYCDSFGEEPVWPHLWILDHVNSSFHPPFGETVNMDNR